MAARSFRERCFLVLRIGIGLTTFALLVFFFDPREVMATLRGTSIPLAALALAMTSVVVLLRAFRWREILRDVGIGVPFLRLVEIYVISCWFTTFLPGSVGGDAYKIYAVAKASAKRARPAVTVLIERATGLLALLAIAAVVALLFHHMLPVPTWALLLLIGLMAGGLATLIVSIRYWEGIWKGIARRFPLMHRLIPEERVANTAPFLRELTTRGRLFAKAFGFGLLLQFVVLATYYVVSLALGGQIPFVFFLVFFPLIEVVSMTPVTINGMGLKEALLVVFLRYAGVPPAFALSLSILYRLLLMVFAIAGGVLFVFRRNTEWQAEVQHDD